VKFIYSPWKLTKQTFFAEIKKILSPFRCPWPYSGFNFSHYELLFPTCDCIPYVRYGLYQLVIRVKGFRVCVLHSIYAVTSMRIAFRSFVLFGVDTMF